MVRFVPCVAFLAALGARPKPVHMLDVGGHVVHRSLDLARRGGKGDFVAYQEWLCLASQLAFVSHAWSFVARY